MKLCRNLKLSIDKLEDTMGNEQVKITLEDSLNLTVVEVCYDVNITTQQSRQYHVKEAIVIAIRRVVDEAVKRGMIDLISKPHGASTTLNSSSGVNFPTEFSIEQDVP
jgi:DhnA family fructose-bisphosphate aldolase class Ia